MQNQITTPGPLLNENGDLMEKGYSVKMLKQYNRKDIKVSKCKIKEWDYYLIYNDKFGVALTIADNGYMGLLSASVLDFTKQTEITKSIMTFMPVGKFNLPSTSVSGDIHYSSKKVSLHFTHTKGGRLLNFSMKNFDKKTNLSVNIELTKEPLDSMVIHTPFDKEKHFYYNQKIIGFYAQGSVEYGDVKIEFNPKESMGLLDWGRGVWTYKNTWYWGAGAGKVNGKMFGFNIGYGFGNTTSASENMLFFDGKAHKLEDITFNIPILNDKDDFLSPWNFSSSDGRFEMKFTPILNRKSYTNALVICSNQNQVFGKFDGTAILDDGTKIVLKDFVGFAEKVYNKW